MEIGEGEVTGWLTLVYVSTAILWHIDERRTEGEVGRKEEGLKNTGLIGSNSSSTLVGVGGVIVDK